MFSLIVTLIAIALVAVLAIATIYYGGDVYVSQQAKVRAATLDAQSQQIYSAAMMYNQDTGGGWPANVMVLAAGGKYLNSAPVPPIRGGSTGDGTTVPEVPSGGGGGGGGVAADAAKYIIGTALAQASEADVSALPELPLRPESEQRYRGFEYAVSDEFKQSFGISTADSVILQQQLNRIKATTTSAGVPLDDVAIRTLVAERARQTAGLPSALDYTWPTDRTQDASARFFWVPGKVDAETCAAVNLRWRGTADIPTGFLTEGEVIQCVGNSTAGYSYIWLAPGASKDVVAPLVAAAGGGGATIPLTMNPGQPGGGSIRTNGTYNGNANWSDSPFAVNALGAEFSASFCTDGPATGAVAQVDTSGEPRLNMVGGAIKVGLAELAMNTLVAAGPNGSTCFNILGVNTGMGEVLMTGNYQVEAKVGTSTYTGTLVIVGPPGCAIPFQNAGWEWGSWDPLVPAGQSESAYSAARATPGGACDSHWGLLSCDDSSGSPVLMWSAYITATEEYAAPVPAEGLSITRKCMGMCGYDRAPDYDQTSGGTVLHGDLVTGVTLVGGSEMEWACVPAAKYCSGQSDNSTPRFENYFYTSLADGSGGTFHMFSTGAKCQTWIAGRRRTVTGGNEALFLSGDPDGTVTPPSDTGDTAAPGTWGSWTPVAGFADNAWCTQGRPGYCEYNPGWACPAFDFVTSNGMYGGCVRQRCDNPYIAAGYIPGC